MGQFRWRGQDRRVVWGIVLLLLLRLVLAATINLSPQEAYYWNYSIHPDLSYLDHPPNGGLGDSSRHAVVGEMRDWGENRRLVAGCRFDLAHQRSGAVVV